MRLFPALLAVAAATPALAESASPQLVHVGVYMHHIPELDLKSNTYLADFFIWFRWQGDRDPSRTLEFTNVADAASMVKTPIYAAADGTSEPTTMPDGSHYQQFHVQGRFTHQFSVQRYPFDEQDIVISFEDNQSVTSELRYVVDTIGKSGLHPGLSLTGWEVKDVRLDIGEERYASNFGDTRVKENAEAFTHATFVVHLQRPVWGSLVKTIIPLLIVLLITLVVFLIGSEYFEARLGLAITTLISAVALQLTSSADLPNVGYVVLLDKIYNISYAIIFVATLESVIAVRLHDKERGELARTLDRVTLVASLVASLAVGLWLVLTR